ncbi:MAG TPA: DUF3471 domain-containing protein, partial [Vicinamibacterales bacterium]
RREIAVSAAVLKKYVGAYELGSSSAMTITLEGDQLVSQLGPQKPIPIFAQSETVFFAKTFDAQIEFAPDGSYIVVTQGGREMKATRRK